MALRHEVKKIAEHDPKEWKLVHIMPSANNKRVVWRAEERFNGFSKLYDMGKLIGVECGIDHRWSIAPDGGRLAVSKRSEDGRCHQIFINHVPMYSVPYDTMYNFEWIGDSLAWCCWNQADDPRVTKTRHFLDGDDLTGLLYVTPMWRDRHFHQIYVADFCTDRSYWLFDDGRVVEAGRAVKWEERRWRDRAESEEHAKPKVVHDEKRGVYRVSYRDVMGPFFNGIEHFGSMGEFTLSDDRSRVAYCGIKRSMVTRGVDRFLNAYGDRMENGRVLSTLVLRPLVLLYGKASKRHVVVDHDCTWKKQYRFADLYFYTADNRLVVMAHENKSSRIVINQQEGPLFGHVHNPRVMPGEHELSYIGVNGNEIFRVSVAL